MTGLPLWSMLVACAEVLTVAFKFKLHVAISSSPPPAEIISGERGCRLRMLEVRRSIRIESLPKRLASSHTQSKFKGMVNVARWHDCSKYGAVEQYAELDINLGWCLALMQIHRFGIGKC